eukprot:g5492.t1 g5492   contig2:643402-644898(+)
MGGGKRNRHNNPNNSGNKHYTSGHHKHNAKSRDHQPDSEEEWDEESLDFCQRFFGDPLFSNLNVALLFLLATFLPMIVWIPHFASEYKRLRQIQYEEEERLMRMRKSREDLQQRQQQGQGGQRKKSALDDFGPTRALPNGQVVYDYKPYLESKNKATHQNIQTPPLNDDITILQEDVFGFGKSSLVKLSDHDERSGGEVHTGFDERYDNYHPGSASVLPTICPDGVTMGYDNWFTLRDAISEANAMAAEDFLRWNEYLVQSAKNKSTEPPVFREPEPFVICPGVKLNQKSPYRTFSLFSFISALSSILPYNNMFTNQRLTSTRTISKSKSKLSPIFVNAEDITIECDRCTVDLPGTHFAFGPHAKNVLIKGVTFRGATTSSCTFHQHGADVNFEDCFWLYNSGGVVNNGKNAPLANINANEGILNNNGVTAGAVADLNSTSTVRFYRCVMDDQKQRPKRTNVGAGVANVPGMNPPAGHVQQNNNNGGGSTGSSLSIRN